MNKLFEYIRRNGHIILFVLFQVLSFLLIVVFNPYQQAKFNGVFLEISGIVNGWNQAVNQYFQLANQNQQLIYNFGDSSTTFSHLNKVAFFDDTITINDPKFSSQFEIFPATVIYNTVHKKNNVFIINRGSNHGIKKSLGVLSPNGVAGIVIGVTPNYSTVMSVLNSEFKLIPQIEENEYYSSIEWNRTKPEYLEINGVNKQEKLEKETLVTTGKSSAIFPQGIPIGTIKKLNKNTTSQYYNILVKPATDFRRLGIVFVLENKHKDEIELHLNEH